MSTQPLEDFENFTRGLPINEDLARLRDDPNFTMPAAVQPSPARGPIEDVERELDRSEKLALKELRMSPGWPVLERLLEKVVHNHRKSVISMSEADPLSNKDAIAAQWAYLTMLKAARNSVVMLVDAEVKAFDEEARRR
jgi:hypothetical protein